MTARTPAWLLGVPAGMALLVQSVVADVPEGVAIAMFVLSTVPVVGGLTLSEPWVWRGRLYESVLSRHARSYRLDRVVDVTTSDPWKEGGMTVLFEQHSRRARPEDGPDAVFAGCPRRHWVEAFALGTAAAAGRADPAARRRIEAARVGGFEAVAAVEQADRAGS